MMKTTITNFLSVRSHKKWLSSKDGNRADMTCGIVSPTMMQKAIIPPKALILSAFVLVRSEIGMNYKAH